ncbi:MAG: hypothetical protein IKZ88_03450 [Neisseriaceae bacterium]|nr:hypothetical protein [Neisseriaceae bacterium]
MSIVLLSVIVRLFCVGWAIYCPRGFNDYISGCLKIVLIPPYRAVWWVGA